MLPYLREHFGNPSSGHVYGRRAHDAVAAARAPGGGTARLRRRRSASSRPGAPRPTTSPSGAWSRPAASDVTSSRRSSSIRRRSDPVPGWNGTERASTRIGVDARRPGTRRGGARGHRCGYRTRHRDALEQRNRRAAADRRTRRAGARKGRGPAHGCRTVGRKGCAQGARAGRRPAVRRRPQAVRPEGRRGALCQARHAAGPLRARCWPRARPATGHGERGRDRRARRGVRDRGPRLETVAARIAGLRDDLWERLEAAVPGIQLNGHRTLRLPNTLNVRFPRASGNAILEGAPEIAASTGSACHAGGESASAVILAMGVAPGRRDRLDPAHARSRDDVLQMSWRRPMRSFDPGEAQPQAQAGDVRRQLRQECWVYCDAACKRDW